MSLDAALFDQRRLTLATEVHHRKPISEGGGKYDWANLQSVCGDCQDEAHGARPKIRIDPRTGLPLPGQIIRGVRNDRGAGRTRKRRGAAGYLVGFRPRPSGHRAALVLTRRQFRICSCLEGA